ncbi:1,4-alpha-glucan branching enzyme [Blautia sp.]|uniref:1,4-alpha-glucan branching enzyme n=1 Tax=Blautia sp. TaxID=1955243 RepID=UPI003AF61418
MESKVYKYMDWPEIEAVVYGEEAAPRDLMAPRMTADGVLVQGFFPDADSVEVLVDTKTYKMEKQDEAGYFAVMLPMRKIPPYQYRITKSKEVRTVADPYAFPVQITEDEEKAFCAGVYYHAYEKLGAHPKEIDGVTGTSFAVWAPNALRVSVVGDFNNWDGRCHMMHRMPMSGIYELFIPGVGDGAVYKYEMKLKGGTIQLKSDPYAVCTELPPASASVVKDLRNYVWDDATWMDAREKYKDRHQPVSIYETSLTAWENAQELVDYVKKMKYTHVELHPVMEYLNEDSGEYSTFAYYAPDRRFGMPEDFQQLVNALHKENIGVILDWTPSHFPREEGGLELFDGTPLYENPDPSMAIHPMWGTLLFNFDSPMVKDFLLSNAFYWMEFYHADGLRLDDVDSMLYLDFGREYGQWRPNIYGTNENLEAVEFLKHLNSILQKKLPGTMTIAQEDGLWSELTGSVEDDNIGFSYKWNNNWAGDFLNYLSKDPIERQYVHDQLTLSMLYTYCEHFVLPLGSRQTGDQESFMAKLPGDDAQKMSQIRAAYSYMMLHPGCKMMAPDKEVPEELQKFIHDLNELYVSQPAMYQMDDDYEGFEWIQLMKYEENVLTFLRKTENPDETLLAVCNFAAVPYENYQVGVPFYGKYKEIFNSDRKEYGGQGIVNLRAKTCKQAECDEREYSVTFKIPALGVAVFSCTPGKKPEKLAVAAKKPETAKKTTRKVAAKKDSTKKAAAKKVAAKKTSAVKKTLAKKVAEKKIS